MQGEPLKINLYFLRFQLQTKVHFLIHSIINVFDRNTNQIHWLLNESKK